MKKIFLFAAVFSLFSCMSFSEDELLGTKAQEFTVKSGDNKELNLSDIKGKVVTLFYETKNTIETNRALKTELNKFYEEQPDRVKQMVARVAVVNCKGIIFSGSWKSALRENSKKEGLAIYGDWTGKMAADYKVKANDSNFIILDKHGVIRYYYSGVVDSEQIKKIKDLLQKLIEEH